MCQSSKQTLQLLLLIACCLVFFTAHSTKATSTECQRDQTVSSISVKRSTTATLQAEDVELLEAITHSQLRMSRMIRISRVVRRIGRTIPRALSRLFRVFRSRSKVIRSIYDQSKPVFNGNIGPYKAKLENRTPYTSVYTEKVKKNLFKKKTVSKTKDCVACRVNCMKHYSALGGSIFKKCTQQYYYYGCELVAPCYKEKESIPEVIEGALVICKNRNGCSLKEEFNFLKEDKGETKANEKRLKKVIEGIYSS